MDGEDNGVAHEMQELAVAGFSTAQEGQRTSLSPSMVVILTCRANYIRRVRRPSNLLILVLGFLVAMAGTFIFGYRAGRYAHRLRRENEPIRPWMSVPFIAHTHHVPSEVLFRAIGVEPKPHDRRPLRGIARAEHRPVDDLIRDLEKALAEAGHMHPSLEPPAGKAP